MHVRHDYFFSLLTNENYCFVAFSPSSFLELPLILFLYSVLQMMAIPVTLADPLCRALIQVTFQPNHGWQQLAACAQFFYFASILYPKYPVVLRTSLSVTSWLGASILPLSRTITSSAAWYRELTAERRRGRMTALRIRLDRTSAPSLALQLKWQFC